MYEDKLGFLFLDYASINIFWFPFFVGALCCCRLRDDVRTLLVVLERTRWFVLVCLFKIIYQQSTRLSRGYCCLERAAVVDGECPRYAHTTSNMWCCCSGNNMEPEFKAPKTGEVGTS